MKNKQRVIKIKAGRAYLHSSYKTNKITYESIIPLGSDANQIQRLVLSFNADVVFLK